MIRLKLYTKEKGGGGKHVRWKLTVVEEHVRLKLAPKEKGGARASQPPLRSYGEQPSGPTLNGLGGGESEEG